MKKAMLVATIVILLTCILVGAITNSYRNAYAEELIPPAATTPYPGQVLPCNPRLPECTTILLPLICK